MNGRPVRVLAVASSGGHWDQLMRVGGAWRGAEVSYAVTMAGLAERAGLRADVIPDFSARTPLRLIAGLAPLWRLVWRVRPEVAISTGAAPGLIALIFARLLGARTIWIDSIANVETLSLSGRLAGLFADVHLTQWESLARPGGPHYWGAVL